MFLFLLFCFDFFTLYMHAQHSVYAQLVVAIVFLVLHFFLLQVSMNDA